MPATLPSALSITTVDLPPAGGAEVVQADVGLAPRRLLVDLPRHEALEQRPGQGSVWIREDGRITRAQGITEKREALREANPEDCLLLAWPGQYRQDVFLIDNRGSALSGVAPHELGEARHGEVDIAVVLGGVREALVEQPLADHRDSARGLAELTCDRT
jgi:hypothetical protein